MSETCPKCGSEWLEGREYGTRFHCESVLYHSGEIQQSVACLVRQITAKDAENKRLREIVAKLLAALKQYVGMYPEFDDPMNKKAREAIAVCEAAKVKP